MTRDDEDESGGFGRRTALLLIGAGAAATALALHRTETAAAAGRHASKDQLIIGLGQEPTVFNPHKPHVEVDEGVHYAIYDTLFKTEGDGGFVPSLATIVPTVANGGISADGTRWRLLLRKGVTWHDGRPFTARDVQFTIELLTDPTFASWRRTGHDLVRDFEIVSPHEATWTMATPFAGYASILATTFIVPAHLFEGATDRNASPLDRAPVGTGPFRFVSRTPGDAIPLAANRAYFGDGPHLQRVMFKYVPDATVLYVQFKSRDIDVVSLPWISPENYGEARRLSGDTIEIAPSAQIEALSFNLARPPFDDPAVRQAFYAAIDKRTIIDTLFSGVMHDTETFLPKQSFYFNPDLPGHAFDPDKARRLLEAAGWTLASDGVRVKNGQRLSFRNSTTSGNYLRELTQQCLQQACRDVGMEMIIDNMPAAVLFGDFYTHSRFHSIIHGQDYGTGSDPDTSTYFLSTNCAAKGGKGMNAWQYDNPEVDRLLAEGSACLVPEQRRPIYHRVQAIIREDLPFLPLFQKARVSGRVAGLSGYADNVNARIDTWNIAQWKRA